MVGVHEHRAGVLFPEAAVQTHLELAEHQGATVRPNERLLGRFVPFAKGPIRDRAVCLHSNAPHGHFIVDRYPGGRRGADAERMLGAPLQILERPRRGRGRPTPASGIRLRVSRMIEL